MLWILTQDKKSLIQVKEVTVQNKVIMAVISKSLWTEWTKFLGNFETHERALEVVHEIVTTMGENNGTACTYIMPEN